MTYKLIIFDFDGIIVKSDSCLRNTIYNFDKCDLMECSAMSLITLGRSIPYVGPIFKQLPLSVIEAFSGEYKPIMDVINFIKDTSGYKMAILSDDTRQLINEHLERLGISRKFDAIVSGEDVWKLKPYPEGLRKILKKTKVHSDEAIYLGSYIDRMTANNAQIRFVSSLNDLEQVLQED
jgi:haloacid dehalogenase superfamily, subfamily IA, variant 1 with third motif having Dx(3-4)D or Dx(3-4)E